MGRCKPLGSLNSFHSHAPRLSGANPISSYTLLLSFPQLLCNHLRGWQLLLDHRFGSPNSHLEARNRWGCDISYLLIWQEIVHFTVWTIILKCLWMLPNTTSDSGCCWVAKSCILATISLGSKITVDSECSHEIKRRLLFGRIAMTNPGSVFESRDITLLTKVCIVKAMVFPVVMYGRVWP